jgi:hypothetical protein
MRTLILIGFVACTATPLADPPPRDPVEARLSARFCVGENPDIVALMTNTAGEIGGYHVTRPIRDSPITYFRADDTVVGGFHIFGDPAENEKSKAAIADLRSRYPQQRSLDCPKSAK